MLAPKSKSRVPLKLVASAAKVKREHRSPSIRKPRTQMTKVAHPLTKETVVMSNDRSE